MKALPESSGKLIGWLESQLKKLDEKASLRLTLRHIAGAKTPVVNRWEVSRANEPHELAKEIAEAAQTDTHFMGGGLKRYELLAIVNGENVGRYGLRVEDAEQDEDDAGNNRGGLNDAAVALVKQSQDHTQAMARALVALAVGNEKSRLAELDRLAARGDALEAKLDRMRELIEQAQDKQFDREMKKEEFKNGQRRLDEVFSTGRVMAPFLVNSLAKKDLLPTGDNSILKEALRPVMEELTEDQLIQLQRILKPSQAVGLIEVWKLLKKEEKQSNGETAHEQGHGKV